MKIEFAKRIFWTAFVAAVLSFSLPFFDGETGFKIYKEVFKFLFIGTFSKEITFIFFLMTCTALWLPIMAYSFRRYTLQKRHYTINQRLINYFLFVVGFSVYALPVYLFYETSYLLSLVAWGYWLLMFCMTMMFICYLIVQKEQLLDDDISKHLVDN